ncbi:hypothetical protein KDL29_12670 [bacterium]|nr:hypothetical protein [bacterium]
MRILLATLIALLPALAAAQDKPDYREMHREAARKYFNSFEQGLLLSGRIEQNGSEGDFRAVFHDDVWIVKYNYGDLQSISYYGEKGNWAGSNYTLPYQIEEKDSPSNAVMNILASGDYLNDPWWDDMHYIDEDAGGYNFVFSPEGLPPVKLVMFSDKDDPEYMQVMTSEVRFAPDDPESITYRTFYYYTTDEEGRLITEKETSSELDQNGNRINFTEYIVDHTEMVEDIPAEFNFDFERHPVGNPQQLAPEGVDVDIVVKNGYMFVPLSFEGSDNTHYFLLDTGASASLFSPAAAADANFETSLNTKAHGHGSSADFSIGLCESAYLGTASGDHVKLSGFPATVIDPGSSQVLIDTLGSYGASGLMGISLFHQYVTRFDLPNNRITLYNADNFDPDTALSRPYAFLELDVEDLVYALGRLNYSVLGEVVIDTGLQLDLALLSETLDHYGVELEKQYSGESTVVGGVRKFDFVNVPAFDIGPLHLENKIASLTSDDRGTMSGRLLLGYVGVFFFQQQRVTLDLFNQKMYIEPDAEVQQQMRENFEAQQQAASDGEDAPADPAGGDEMATSQEEGNGG